MLLFFSRRRDVSDAAVGVATSQRRGGAKRVQRERFFFFYWNYNYFSETIELDIISIKRKILNDIEFLSHIVFAI